MIKHSLILTILLTSSALTLAAGQTTRTIVYDGVATDVSVSDGAANDLWITASDLTRATRFVIKPQGVCRDELCFPLPKNRKAEFIAKKNGTTWFNLSEFARLVRQPVARDDKNGVWYFGKREDERGTYLASLEAPNFTLRDMAGRSHSLADYRGKKVLLITWASW